MTREDYCSYEVSRLLEEKGFHAPDLHGLDSSQGHLWVKVTHQMAMKWLREVHNIHIVILPTFAVNGVEGDKNYVWDIAGRHTTGIADSYSEAVETALKYVLENLI